MEWATQGQSHLIALGVAALVLLAATFATARPPGVEVPGLDGYFDRWRGVHGGYDPRTGSVWVRGWLSGVHRVARPLARRGVQPDVLTLWTILVSLGVLAAAAGGGRWRIVAGWLIVLGGVGDSLDGAVAVLTGRETQWGYVLDSVVDRINDVLYVTALVIVGAPVALAVVCGVSFFCLEYLRARGANAGAGAIGAITVGERPNRVAFCAAGIHFSGVFLASAELIVTAALAALTALSLAGLLQLTVAVRRRLR